MSRRNDRDGEPASRHDAKAHQPHPRCLSGRAPEADEVDRHDEQPRRAGHGASGRRADRRADERRDQRDPGAHHEEGDVRDRRVGDERDAASAAARETVLLGASLHVQHLPDVRLDAQIAGRRAAPCRLRDVVAETCRLGRERVSHLGASCELDNALPHGPAPQHSVGNGLDEVARLTALDPLTERLTSENALDEPLELLEVSTLVRRRGEHLGDDSLDDVMLDDRTRNRLRKRPAEDAVDAGACGRGNGPACKPVESRDHHGASRSDVTSPAASTETSNRSPLRASHVLSAV
jgi:hypothetical protein